MSRGGWKGVTWLPIERGRCTVHGTIVGTVTLVCAECHREQLTAARVVSPAVLAAA